VPLRGHIHPRFHCGRRTSTR